jgi:ABC-type polysaccharide/polyol phosphate transport system ATPase subunit
MDLLQRVCNRAIFLDKGAIQFEGSVPDAVRAYKAFWREAEGAPAA